MQKELNCKAQIQKDEENLYVSPNVKGRIIKFTGTTDKILKFIKFFSDELVEVENSF